MAQSIKQNDDYKKLCRDLSELIEKGRMQAVQAVSKVLVETYWKIGKRLLRMKDIVDVLPLTELINRLGKDLDLDPTVLQRSLRFFRAYPGGLPRSPDARRLGWGAHLELLPIKDPEQRLMYMRQAIEENWSRAALRRAIRRRLFEGDPVDRHGDGQWLDRPDSRLHTYAAALDRVIDGDTLEVRIDLGFDVWKTEHIRLRGIDAPELNTKAGRAARIFVLEKLENIEFVILRTYKTDKYARYVTDLFYSDIYKEKEQVISRGSFLNQELIDSGHACFVRKFT